MRNAIRRRSRTCSSSKRFFAAPVSVRGGLRVVVEEGATHSEGAWAKRFPQALEFLYGRE